MDTTYEKDMEYARRSGNKCTNNEYTMKENLFEMNLQEDQEMNVQQMYNKCTTSSHVRTEQSRPADLSLELFPCEDRTITLYILLEIMRI